MTDKEKIRTEVQRLKNELEVSSVAYPAINVLSHLQSFIDSLPEEPVSEDLEEAMQHNAPDNIGIDDLLYWRNGFIAGALCQKQQDQSTIELAEDHAYFAGRTKTIEEIEEKLLSEVLPCFMHGGEADEVVAKLDEVLNI